MMQFLNATVLLSAAVALLFLCVLLTLIHVDRNNKALSREIAQLRKENAALQGRLMEKLDRSQEESRANAEAMSGSVSRALSEMARSQQSQLDDFARRSEQHRRTQEEQLNGVIGTLVNAVSRMQGKDE